MHPSVATLQSINQFILEKCPGIWIHSLDDKSKPGTIKIKVSGISPHQEIHLARDLYDRLPAGVCVDLRVVSTTSEFFKPGKVNRPDAPWKDIK